MLRHIGTLSAIHILLVGANAASIIPSDGGKAHAKSEFMNAMRDVQPSGRSRWSAESSREERKKEMYRALLSRAVRVPSEDSRPTHPGSSLLRRLAEDTDDAQYNASAGGYDVSDYGFDPTEYSLKYGGCSAISTYSDDLAEANANTDRGANKYGDSSATPATVFVTKPYVVFRFCPSKYCSNSGKYGCTSNYGEYMVPMADWLEIVERSRDDLLQQYCQYCEKCINSSGNQDRKRRRLDDAEAGDDGADADQGENVDGDDAGVGDEDANGDENVADGDDVAAAVEDEFVCESYDACYNYTSVCEADATDKINYTAYFECTAFDVDDNTVVYLGPHCNSDKSTIVIGMYSDQYCSDYIGNNYNISDVTGIAFTTDGLSDYYATDCVSCKASDLAWQVTNGDDEDSDAVSEICEDLYFLAAKCNKHMGSATYGSYQQASNENTACSFIESIVTGHYDEHGFIYVDASQYQSDNAYNQYAHSVESFEEVTLGQAFGIFVLVLLTCLMLTWSCFLHRAVTKKSPWKGPTRDRNASLAGQISRQNSGIVMGRSRSGGSYHGGTLV